MNVMNPEAFASGFFYFRFMFSAAGHLQDMVNRIKANRALMNNRKSIYKPIKTYLKSNKRKRVILKKATPEQLKQARLKALKLNQAEVSHWVRSILVGVVIAIGIIWALVEFSMLYLAPN